MKPQKEKDIKPSTLNKLGHAEKRIVPQNMFARKCSVIYQPNDFSRDFSCDIKPIKFFPEWNEKEAEILNLEFEKIMAEPEGTFPKFEDPDSNKINLPHSIQSEGNFNIKWLRPEKYIKENLLDREIKKRHPDVNNIKLREQFKEMYISSLSSKKARKATKKKFTHRNTLSSELSTDSQVIEDSPDPGSHNANIIPKDFIELLSNPVEIKVVSVIEVEETDVEYEKRTLGITNVKKEDNRRKTLKTNQLFNPNNQNSLAGSNLHGGEKNKHLNNNNSKQQGLTIEPEVKIKLRNKHCVHTDINIQDRYADYSQWVASIFQMIKDRNIFDAYTSENIFQKIYPQKDGAPVYNPHGKYWIKLYYMGKLRRIEIDDTMPCSKYDEFLLPKTQNFGEIWPALLTKALIKLHSHKFSATSEEIGDCSIIYSLTAHVAEKISLQKSLNQTEEKLMKILTILSAVLKDENYKKSQPILLAFAKSSYDLIKEAEIKAKTIEKKFLTRATMNEFETRKLDDDNVPSSIAPKASRPAKRFSTTKILIPIYDSAPSKSFSQRPDAGTYQNMIYDFVNQSYANTKKNQDANENQKKNERINNKIFSNCLYSVVELFDNNNFNMKRLKPLDFTDLREKIGDYLKAPLKQLSLEDKKIYIQKLKELKAKQKEEKLKRIEDLKPEGRRIRLIKIKNSPDLNLEHLFVPYTNDEIEMTKKCLLNQWDFPPPTFLNKVYKDKLISFKLVSDVDDHHEKISDNLLHHDLLNTTKDSPGKTSKNSWAYDNYLGLINNNLEKYETSKELMKRDDGSWITLNEFCSLFDYFVVLYNPRNFRSNLNYDSNWYNYENDIYEHNTEYSVFRLNPKLDAIDSYNLKTNSKKGSLNNITDSNKSCIVIMFNANTDSRMDLKDSNYYMLFDIYDKNQNLIEKNLKVTNYNMAIQYDGLEFSQEYFLHLKGGLYSMGFYLSIMSDHIVENISYANYLKNYCDYFSQNYKISHKPLEKNKTSLLMRLRINNRNEDTKLFFNLNGKCYSDNYFLKFFDFYLVQGRNTATKKIYSHDQCNLAASKDNYYIILTVTPPYNILENQFEFEVLSSSRNITLENLDRIETSELEDDYTPNKHGIIFKELIYAADKSYTTFSINVANNQNLNMNILNRKGSMFSREEFTSSKSLFDKQNKDTFDKAKLVLEIYNTLDGSLVFKSDFFHSVLIPNLVLEFESQIQVSSIIGNVTNHPAPSDNKKNLKENPSSLIATKPFMLICYFHPSEFPNCLDKNKTQDLSWLIRVFSSDSLVFVRDTSKEDSERALKESWEQKEPGRAERAKISRVKYMISQKIENNQALNEDEENFLKEERERRLKPEINVIINQKEENKGNKPVVTLDKKNKNQTANKAHTSSKGLLTNNETKTPDNVDLEKDPAHNIHLSSEKTMLHYNKPIPTSDKHVSSYVKNFLNYSCEKRTKIFDNKLIGDEKILCDEKKTQEIKEKINRENENYHQNKITNNEMDRLSMMNETFKAFYEINQHHRIDQEETKILFKLKDDSKKFISKKDAEKKLLEIIQNKENDLNVCIQSYKEIASSNLKSDLLEIVHDLISRKKEEFIKFELKKNEKNPKELKLIAQKYLEDLSENKWKLSKEIISRLNEFLK